MILQENIILSHHTTLRLGGAARYFCSCTSLSDLKEAFDFARSKNLRTHILGSGSNTIFADAGFDGLVMKIDLQGISSENDGKNMILSAQGGEEWDQFVKNSVEKGYAGLECLSGIPGRVGAVPIQNVGAYGQEVKETIVSVKALERSTMKEIELTAGECSFGYRRSRFKNRDAGKYIITEVVFRLHKNGRPAVKYPELKKEIGSQIQLASLADGRESLEAVRKIVLSLRRKKSMVIDPNDPNSRSVGSFFMNPIIDKKGSDRLAELWKKIGDESDVPMFETDGKIKIPAAWLIERSGFQKGYTKNGIGISENHTLALVNRDGTTSALLLLAEAIQEKVSRQFSIRLEMEPVIVQP